MRGVREQACRLSGELTLVTDKTTVRRSRRANQTAVSMCVCSARRSPARAGVVRALDRKGCARRSFVDFAGPRGASQFEMPSNCAMRLPSRNRSRTFGSAVFLLDERWVVAVRLVSGETADLAQPLLAPAFISPRRFPFADVRRQPSPPIRYDPSREHVAIMILAMSHGAGEAHDDLKRLSRMGHPRALCRTHLAGLRRFVPVRLRRARCWRAMSWIRRKNLRFDREAHSSFGCP